ncbi:MAG: M61 family peptidase [Candidatus Eremiobacteraeota bacterium]|nr:M61 family peptidase [Candidatus Eremiobacteraeota bacterium]
MNRFVWALAAAALVGVTAAGLPTRAQDEFANTSSLSTAVHPMTLELDARQAGRGLMFAHLSIPAKPGDFTLVYPKWIPGEHGPTGPLHDIAALRFSAQGRALGWRRDNVDMYAFHIDVPAGVDELDADFTVLLNAPGDVMATRNVAVVNWNRALLYQANTKSHEVFAKASIVLPRGWDYGTALLVDRRSGGRIGFAQTTLAMLVDSPLDCGAYVKHVPEWSGAGATAQLDLFADRPQDLDVAGDVVKAYKATVPQGLRLYGARHWNVYHSLLTLSDAIGFQGIEHHQSSDDRASDDFLTNPRQQLAAGDLLTHEFSHSWNGKYRRPADLTTANFQIPMQTDLLWIYEGMNQYLGDLLSFRAGIRKPKQYPEYLATVYAKMDYEPGRQTTPLIDLTTSAPYLYQAEGDYPSLRRAAGDFYTEGELMWLDADTIIRDGTGGRKSLDDFLHLFAGPPTTGPITVTYTRDDVERLLGQVLPYDWHGFFQRYVYAASLHPPTDELARSGWKLVYTSKPNDFIEAENSADHGANFWYSIGINVDDDGSVRDVRQGSAAFAAGVAPGMKIAAVNGQSYSSDGLEYAIKTAAKASAKISLLGERNKWYATYDLSYRGGLRYPHLVRIANKPDMLAKIMAPRPGS